MKFHMSGTSLNKIRGGGKEQSCSPARAGAFGVGGVPGWCEENFFWGGYKGTLIHHVANRPKVLKSLMAMGRPVPCIDSGPHIFVKLPWT